MGKYKSINNIKLGRYFMILRNVLHNTICTVIYRFNLVIIEVFLQWNDYIKYIYIYIAYIISGQSILCSDSFLTILKFMHNNLLVIFFFAT